MTKGKNTLDSLLTKCKEREISNVLRFSHLINVNIDTLNII